MTFPRQRPRQSHDDHQREMAAWVGYSVEDLNANHDATHDLLCRFLEVQSHSLMCARGEPYDTTSAEIEQAAVLHVQMQAVDTVSVSEHVPIETGLLDASGDPIMRAPYPIGFGRDEEWA